MRTIKDGSLVIDIGDLIDRLSPEDRLQLIESLSCHCQVIQHVMDQVTAGRTANGYHGATGSAVADPGWPGLDRARREVARLAGDVAASEIKRLEDALSRSVKECNLLIDKLSREIER